MIRLRIDSVVCDLAAEQPLTLAWSGRTLTDPEAGRSGEALTFELLPTAAAEALFGAECHLYGAGRFNAALHRGELLAGGTPLASGSVRLVETRWHGTEHRYRVELRGGAHAWAEQAAKEWFRELEVAYEGRLLPTEIAAGWSDDSPVKFLPVYRDRYEIENGDAGLRPPERLLSTDDYHPFLSIRALVQALFAKAGYTVESAFMENPWFRSLYMSGAYASHDTRVRQQKMGFLARRKADRTTTANALGRVEANPFVTHNTVGNLVDAFSPQEVDETGATLTDAYSAGGCLRIEEGELCFRPLTEVSVGFEYELRYTTDYRIRSRTRLTGFDSVWLGEDADVRFELANRFEDRREALRPSFQYRIVVFDHTEGNRWTLRCTTDGAETTLTDFTTRSTLFTTPQGTTLVNARLYRNVSGVYVPYTEDWALYDGYIGETGRTEVQITVRTSPESVTPTAPKYFRQISFYGAEEGMNFTISRRCRLRPCFCRHPDTARRSPSTTWRGTRSGRRNCCGRWRISSTCGSTPTNSSNGSTSSRRANSTTRRPSGSGATASWATRRSPAPTVRSTSTTGGRGGTATRTAPWHGSTPPTTRASDVGATPRPPKRPSRARRCRSTSCSPRRSAKRADTRTHRRR